MIQQHQKKFQEGRDQTSQEFIPIMVAEEPFIINLKNPNYTVNLQDDFDTLGDLKRDQVMRTCICNERLTALLAPFVVKTKVYDKWLKKLYLNTLDQVTLNELIEKKCISNTMLQDNSEAIPKEYLPREHSEHHGLSEIVNEELFSQHEPLP